MGNGTDRKVPGADCHHAALPDCLDPVTREDANIELPPRNGATAAGNSADGRTHGNGEHRSQDRSGPGNRPFGEHAVYGQHTVAPCCGRQHLRSGPGPHNPLKYINCSGVAVSRRGMNPHAEVQGS